MTAILHTRVQAFVQTSVPAMLGGRTLLAVSGGGDSTAMAALLCDAGLLDARTAIIAHFDHRLRNAESAGRDRAAVKALCDRYQLEFICGAWHAPRSGEGAARDSRYGFLVETARRVGARQIATGHTSDDQAETVFMRMMRGAGLHGLRGIRPQTTRAGVTLARPLLCLSRAETRAYCAGKGIAFVDDETNGDTSILRNRVRLELLPAMEGVLPGARDALLRTADEAADACCVLEAVAETVIVAKHSGEVVLSKARLRALPEPAWPVALRLAVERLAGDARDLDRRHYAQLGRAIAARTGAVLQLPRGLALHVDRDEIVLIEQAQVRTPILGEIALPFAGVVGDWQLHVTRAQQPSEEQLYLPEGAVIRGRRPGDRIWTRAGTRKLQDVFVDAGVPRRWRDAVPVIADGASVLWTPYGGAGGRDGQLYRIAAERRDGMACA